MSLKSKIFAAGFAFACLGLGSQLPASAHDGGGWGSGRGGHGGHGEMMDGGGMMQGRMMERALRAVNASDEQRTKIRDIFRKAAGEPRPDPNARKAMADKMQALLAAPTVDRNALEALRLERSVDREKRSKRMSAAMGDALEVLTLDQRKQLAQSMAERRKGMEERMQRRGGQAPRSDMMFQPDPNKG